VKEAVAVKTDKLTAKLELSAEWVLGEIKKLAEANMMDYMTITESGEAFVDFSKLTRDQAAAIQEIRVDETGGGGGDGRRERVQRTTFKLADKGLNLERLRASPEAIY
jgi:phage terminase small subunit